MKRKTQMLVVLLVANFQGGLLEATNIDFFDDGELIFGDVYQTANAYETAVVDVLGGSVGTFTAWDSSVINMDDGSISALVGRNNSELNMTSGSVTILNTYDSSVASSCCGKEN